MAEAILSALISSRQVGPHEILASDISVARCSLLKKQYGVNVYSRNEAVVGAVEILFLCIKPQQMTEVLEEIAAFTTQDQLVFSIAAGKTLSFLESLLPQARLIRVMPNLPCVVGDGMTAFCRGRHATAADGRKAVTLLESFSRVVELPEVQFDAVTALSGSGPAFFAYLMQALAQAAVEEGLDADVATSMAAQTMLGTARVLIEKKTAPDAFIRAVTSAKGTTAAGLDVLGRSPVQDLLRQTVHAAAQRSRELSASGRCAGR